ncbi:helicase conserved C-terminal domain containing protein [Culex quinquefasciatus]|uniref:Helicase conserved C-terminal domain containing protein n=1 Tax=Culex quinquefasciatus TaxID=7176 RepID=B0W5S2_CULQU|nr:helicase conserved C-terminal domain containing protein [Culex quinquefasciatus]|eukprot:XP_001844056.1 helicase conserved C-terminal domain containing protein [Culex quinquefasciatus]
MASFDTTSSKPDKKHKNRHVRGRGSLPSKKNKKKNIFSSGSSRSETLVSTLDENIEKIQNREIESNYVLHNEEIVSNQYTSSWEIPVKSHVSVCDAHTSNFNEQSVPPVQVTFAQLGKFFSHNRRQYIKKRVQTKKKIDQLNLSARFTFVNMEIKLHNEGCIMTTDNNFIAIVKLEHPEQLDECSDFEQAKKLLKHFELTNRAIRPFNYSVVLLNRQKTSAYGNFIESAKRMFFNKSKNHLEVSDDVYIWYCMLDEVLSNVLPFASLKHGGELDLFRNILQNYTKLVREAGHDQLETVRVISHSLGRFIVQAIQLLKQDGNSDIEQRVLRGQLDVNSRVGFKSSNYFRDFINVFSDYWRCRNEVIALLPSKMNLPEMDIICNKLVEIIAVALGKKVDADEWLNQVYRHTYTKIAKNRAVIIFFEDDEKLEKFRKEYSAQFDRVNVLTVNTKGTERDQFINEAGVAKTVTLATRRMGRGVDFKSSVTVEKNGGVHVIQTFLSSDVKEEIQIKGRTARKDNKGSYELIVCECDLPVMEAETPLFLNYTYKILDNDRKNKSLKTNEKLAAEIKQAQKDHELTMEYMKTFSKENDSNQDEETNSTSKLNSWIIPVKKCDKNGEAHSSKPAIKCDSSIEPRLAQIGALYNPNRTQYIKKKASSEKKIDQLNYSARFTFVKLEIKLHSEGSIMTTENNFIAAVKFEHPEQLDDCGNFAQAKEVLIEQLRITCIYRDGLREARDSLRKRLIPAIESAIEKSAFNDKHANNYIQLVRIASMLNNSGRMSYRNLCREISTNNIVTEELKSFSKELFQLEETVLKRDKWFAVFKIQGEDQKLGLNDELEELLQQTYVFFTNTLIDGSPEFLQTVLRVALLNRSKTPTHRGILESAKKMITFSKPKNHLAVSDEIFIWYCMLDDVLSNVLPYAAIKHGGKLDLFGDILQNYTKLVGEAGHAQLETVRVISHSLGRFIVQAIQLLKQDCNATVEKRVLHGQLDVVGRVGFESSNYFRDLIDVFSGYWRCRNEIIAELPGKIDLPEMKVICDKLLEIILVALGKGVGASEIVNFCRTYNDFIIDLGEVRFDWFVKFAITETECLDTSILQVVENKWSDSDNATYRVIKLNDFLDAHDPPPKHYTIDRDQFINEAGVAKTVTLGTRQMGRGVDFKSSVVVEKNGGVHVIQTFFSPDVKEEIQIKGRTARKDNKGSYELIVCGKDLPEMEPETKIGSGYSYKILDKDRRIKSLKTNEKLAADIIQAQKNHEMTLEYLKSFCEKK